MFFGVNDIPVLHTIIDAQIFALMPTLTTPTHENMFSL